MSEEKNLNSQQEDTSKEQQYSLNDDRRVKVLSPGAMVAKRFFRNGVAVFGMIVLIFMFAFSFIGGIISPYEEDEKFYTTEYQLKEYAGVTKNEELRFAVADGQEFGGAVQAKTVLAIKQNAAEFVYRDVTYKVTKEGENIHSVSLNGTMIGIAYKDIVSMTNQGADISFDFRLNALKAYAYGIKKYIGAYAAAMGGLDGIVFGGGIGRKSDIIRSMSLEGLEFLGVQLDLDKNIDPCGGDDISANDSKVRIFVVDTNEEIVVARKAKALLEQ
jgi:peptide/nickel transport system permease protein